MTEKPVTLTRRPTSSDAFIKAVESLINSEKTDFVTEIKNSIEGERIASMRVKATFYGDQYTLAYLNERSKQQLNIDRQNAKILLDMVKSTKELMSQVDEDKNIGVKKRLEEFLSGLTD